VAVDASHWIPSERAAFPNGARRRLSHPDVQTDTSVDISLGGVQTKALTRDGWFRHYAFRFKFPCSSSHGSVASNKLIELLTGHLVRGRWDRLIGSGSEES